VDIEPATESHKGRTLLRCLTCGSVDDGKSTLIGRLLYDSGMIAEDQLVALAVDSKKCGTRGGELDFALLVDGLSTEREQGITIDVAYRFFSTERRRFILADSPGHEQYTRNMVTGASTADAAIILIDVRKGVVTQTRRHAFIAALLGIRQVIAAINKMDLVGYSSSAYDAIARDFLDCGSRLGLPEVTCIPVSAIHGHNIAIRGFEMPWYAGPTLFEWLEQAGSRDLDGSSPFRLPVQWVNRPDSVFRGLAGTVTAGQVAVGDRVVVLPSGRESRVRRLLLGDRDLREAVCGQSVTLVLADDVDVSRGDVIADPLAAPAVADRFETTVIWMHEQPLLQGRSYMLMLGPQMVPATVAQIKHQIDIDTLERVPARALEFNAIGACQVELSRPMVFEPYDTSRELGGFIMIDRLSHETVGAGLVRFALSRSDNIHWQSLDVDKTSRARLKGQCACVLWLTGVPASGKSTIANIVEKRLHAGGRHTYLLDGDNVRHGLNKDLGFTAADRVENVRRVAEVARLMTDAGLIVIVAFISPFEAERRMARALFAPGEFFEIFIDTPISVAEQRDPKGLYQKARRGALRNFTGVDSPYERPEQPELRIDTTVLTADDAADAILALLRQSAIVAP
jgi:bifunctional enzyme CysN/CysC